MKDPAFLFYTSDFLTGVATMDMRERGQYITLICLQHQRGHLTLKEIKKAVGKPTEEVLSKFVLDEDGRYFNVRADEEKQKRASHCKKQKENVEKRWNRNRTLVGNTTVLPLENENATANISKDNRELKENVELKVTEEGVQGEEPGQAQTSPASEKLKDPGLARVMSRYTERICATPSSVSTAELVEYTGILGADAVCHAIDCAVDAGARSWNYVRAILRSYAADGVKSLEDVQRREQLRNGRKKASGKYIGAPSPPPPKSVGDCISAIEGKLGLSPKPGDFVEGDNP